MRNTDLCPHYVMIALLPLLLGAAQAPPSPPLSSGTYLLLQETVTVSEIPVLADVVATTRSVSLVQLTRDGERLWGSGPLCSLELLSNSSLVTTELPAAFRRSLPPVQLDARLTPEGDGWRFQQLPQLSVVGAKLAHPATDPLPREPSEATVFDQDGDGKPGVTVRVSGLVSGEIYLAQRAISSLDGSADSQGARGRVTFRQEQAILGATRDVLKDPPKSHPDPRRSRFRLVAVKPTSDCARAIRRAQSL
jgi:hypothetical protein